MERSHLSRKEGRAREAWRAPGRHRARGAEDRRVQEGQGRADKEGRRPSKTARTQNFEGLVLAVKHGTEAGGTFTVRATMSGVGVEKIFPLYSPAIDSIKIIRRSKVRRAKLYFIREKAAKGRFAASSATCA